MEKYSSGTDCHTHMNREECEIDILYLLCASMRGSKPYSIAAVNKKNPLIDNWRDSCRQPGDHNETVNTGSGTSNRQ
jgi:hypothetical protein